MSEKSLVSNSFSNFFKGFDDMFNGFSELFEKIDTYNAISTNNKFPDEIKELVGELQTELKTLNGLIEKMKKEAIPGDIEIDVKIKNVPGLNDVDYSLKKTTSNSSN